MKKLALFMLIAAAGVALILVIQGRSPQVKTEVAGESMAGGDMHGHTGADAMYTGTVTETMDAGGYTYVCIDTGDEVVWAAGPVTTVAKGDEVSIPEGMVMNGFRSESLDRTFDKIYFVEEIRTGKGGEAASRLPAGHPNMGQSDAAANMDFSGIEVPPGGQNIATLFKKKSELAGKKVTVRGKVVKFTGGVMGKNWIHLRDGSGDAEHNDVTVTTDAVAKIGDTVTATGELLLDQDFGYGYSYDILIDSAEVAVEMDS